MNSYLEDWKNRCEYSHQCTSYHKMNYECGIAPETCVLYSLYGRIEERKQDELKSLEKVLVTVSCTDGTAYLEGF